MHYDVVEKLQQARAAITTMETASDYPLFKRAFTECLAAVKSVEYKLDGQTKTSLRKAGRKREIPSFQEWWKAKQTQSTTDPLLKWAGDARDSDTHIQDSEVFGSSYSVDLFQTDDLEPAPPGASLAIGATGAYWIVNEGTVREQRLPARPRPNTPTARALNVGAVWVSNPPASHLGEPLTSTDPITLVRLAVDYWENVADDTFAQWWGGTTQRD